VGLTRESIAVASELEKIDARVTYDDRVDQIDRRESSADGALRLGSAAPALLIASTQRSRECARRKRMTLTMQASPRRAAGSSGVSGASGGWKSDGLFKKKTGVQIG
jgi:hypothetical protein